MYRVPRVRVRDEATGGGIFCVRVRDRFRVKTRVRVRVRFRVRVGGRV